MARKKTKIIYLVWGTSGSYSDRVEWNIKAFKDPQKAKALAEACQARANEFTRDRYYSEGDDAFQKHMEGLDPIARWDDRPDYGTQEIEYEG